MGCGDSGTSAIAGTDWPRTSTPLFYLWAFAKASWTALLSAFCLASNDLSVSSLIYNLLFY